MDKRKLIWFVPSILIMGVCVILGTHLYLHPHGHGTMSSVQGERRALPSIEGIPDGAPLYAFLLKEIPEVVSQIPCSCCGQMLSWCYEGGCPPT